jgi:hypothetical protein
MLNEQGKETKDSVIETAALRFEKRLTEEVASVRADVSATEKRLDNRITTEIAGVREDLASAKAHFEKKLTEEVAGLRNELSERISSVEQRLDNRITAEVSGLRVDLTEKIQKSKTDTIKWMFLFYIGQVGALAGILFVIFK